MGIKIVDCTIRDGGYLLDKNSDPEFVRAIMEGLVNAGIDFVETGFLQNEVKGESIVYNNSQDICKYLPKDRKKTEFLGFCDNSRYSILKLDDCTGTSVRWIRISFAKHELKEAMEFCEKVQDKGYKVQFNPMDTINYTEEELDYLLDSVNKIKPGSVSIVDTFGAMYLDDLEYLFKKFDTKLKKEIGIGLHSHDNLGLSIALAERMIMVSKGSERDIMVDGSLYGMGRGAGNASTELLAEYINKKHNGKYKTSILLDIINDHIIPLSNKFDWGYSLPMFICGVSHAHVDNISFLKDKGCNISDMYNVINSMSEQSRIRYGKNYKKTNFIELSEALGRYKGSVYKNELC